MLSELASHQIPAILIHSPVFSEEGGLITNASGKMRIFKNVAERYQIPFWDYSHDETFWDRRFFSDRLHLNSDGAVLFSSNLVTRLELFLQGGFDAF